VLARRRPGRRRKVTAHIALVRVGRLLGILLVAVIAIVGVKRRAGVLRLLAIRRRALVGALVVALLVPAVVVSALGIGSLVVASLAVTVHLMGTGGVVVVVVAADAEFTARGRHPAGSVEWFAALATTATSDARADKQDKKHSNNDDGEKNPSAPRIEATVADAAAISVVARAVALLEHVRVLDADDG